MATHAQKSTHTHIPECERVLVVGKVGASLGGRARHHLVAKFGRRRKLLRGERSVGALERGGDEQRGRDLPREPLRGVLQREQRAIV